MKKEYAMLLVSSFLTQLQEMARTGTLPANFGIHLDYVNEKGASEVIHLTVALRARKP